MPHTGQDAPGRDGAIIVGSNLLVRYDGNVALDGVDIQINQGEDVAIVGESGSGKTTLAKVLTGLIEPTAGAVHCRLPGQGPLRDVAALSMRQRQEFHNRVQLVFQHADDVLHPGDRVRHVIDEALAVALRLGSARDPRTPFPSPGTGLPTNVHARETVIDRIGRFWHDRTRYGRELLRSVVMGNAEEASRKKCGDLSGGERKRILLARCLASCQFNRGVINGILGQTEAAELGLWQHGPHRVIIADEPLRGVDSITKAHIIRLLRTVKRQLGATLVIITHDLRLLGPLCERVFVMFQGSVVEQGRKSDILTRQGGLAVPEAFSPSQTRNGPQAWTYHHPYTADLVCSVPSATETFREDETRQWLRCQQPPSGLDQGAGDGCPYASRCSFYRQAGRAAACDEVRPRLLPVQGPDSGPQDSSLQPHEVACHLLGRGTPPPSGDTTRQAPG